MCESVVKCVSVFGCPEAGQFVSLMTPPTLMSWRANDQSSSNSHRFTQPIKLCSVLCLALSPAVTMATSGRSIIHTVMRRKHRDDSILSHRPDAWRSRGLQDLKSTQDIPQRNNVCNWANELAACWKLAGYKIYQMNEWLKGETLPDYYQTCLTSKDTGWIKDETGRLKVY